MIKSFFWKLKNQRAGAKASAHLPIHWAVYWVFGIADNGQMIGLADPAGDAEKISEIIKTRLEPVPEFRLKI